MFSNRNWMRVALFLNLFGSVMLFLSFQATSSNIKIVHTKDGRTALCVEGRGLIVSDPFQNGVAIGTSCPDWKQARPAAVVNVEKPFLVTIGFILLTLGFFLQFMSIPSVRTISQIRKELKAATLEDRLRKKKSK